MYIIMSSPGYTPGYISYIASLLCNSVLLAELP